MKLMIHLLWMLISGTMPVLAQEFSIRKIEVAPAQLTLHYDLVDTAKGHTYSIFVYSSKDNFLSPLEKVSGDAGLEVRPGSNRKIVWKAKEELGATFQGEVELEIRGRLYIPFIRFEGFREVEVRKRGVPFIVKWSGGTRQNILNFQLYQNDGQLRHTFPNVPNTSEYRITIPGSVKPGNGYYFRISDTRNKDQVVTTPKFEIRRKYPLALKVIPILLAGGAVYMLLPESGPQALDGPPGTPNETH